MWLFRGGCWVGEIDGGAFLWPLPFAPGCPHPSPLPPSGRGDTSIVGMCAWWMGVLSGGFGGVGLLEGTLGFMTTAGAQVGVCNVPNRTIFEGDNLDVMRGMNDGCVDLIYLDPPFNSNRDYAAPIGSEAAGAAFKDTWDLTDVDEAWRSVSSSRNVGS